MYDDTDSKKPPNNHKEQRDSARAERDSALVERDFARNERDNFKGQAATLVKNRTAQDQFVAAVSHDLRNPIGAIKMALEVLRDPLTVENERLEVLDLIDRNADQAGELINQLLDAHLIKSGAKLPIEFNKCDLLAVYRKCHDSLAPQDQERIILKLDGLTEIWGNWDAYALERAFNNLISNAFKFSDEDKKITISAWQGPDISSISFQDFGAVISLENQLRIFENHFRIQSEELKYKKGWGLGLTLVKGIAEAHNGKVDVTSSKVEGTVFTLKIPNDSSH